MCFEFWDEKFSVGMKDIDDQHKELFKMISYLRNAVKSGKEKEMLINIIENFLYITLASFRLEEEYMSKYNLNNLESHISEHKSFVTRIEDFKNSFTCSDTMSALHGLDYFILWMTFHITEFDKEYSVYNSSAA